MKREPICRFLCCFRDSRGDTSAELLAPPLMGDPDRLYKVVEGSLTPVPWAKVPTAQIMLRPCEKDGSDLIMDPRSVLERIVKRMNEDGLFPVMALEGEFYLIDPTSNPPSPSKPLNGWRTFEGSQVYALEPLRDAQDFLDQLKQSARVQDIPLTSILCEYSDSQMEMNLDHSDDILTACDHYLMLKHLIKNVAADNGQLASFMAMPLANSGGSGCHIHVSVLDRQGNNVFGADEAKLHHAIGGLMDTMHDSLAACAPFANSYRRYRKGSWSPISANWGHNHRLVSLRIPLSGTKDKRVEHRIAGA